MTFHSPFGSVFLFRALLLSLAAHAFLLLQGLRPPFAIALPRPVLQARLAPLPAVARFPAAPDARPAGHEVFRRSPPREALADGKPGAAGSPPGNARSEPDRPAEVVVEGEEVAAFRMALARTMGRLRAERPAIDRVHRLRARVDMEAGGRLHALRVVESSGRADVDAAALSLLGAAVMQTSPPPMLGGQALAFEIEVELSP